jgi:hypothetical protein
MSVGLHPLGSTKKSQLIQARQTAKARNRHNKKGALGRPLWFKPGSELQLNLRTKVTRSVRGTK